MWARSSECGSAIEEDINITKTAGGFVYWYHNSHVYFALIQCEDGSWVLPFGHQKRNESSLDKTAIREVAEEINISKEKLQIIRDIGCYNNVEILDKRKLYTENSFFLMKYASDETNVIAESEHLSVRWWNIEEQLPFMHYIYQKQLVREIIKKEFNIEAKME